MFVYSLMFLFFFKQKTAYEMRISDWSSDVCSSDLFLEGILGAVADLEFESNQQFPPGTSQTTGFHIGGSAFYPDYVVDPDSDIVLKVDGSNTFTTQVPEPGTLGLLGADRKSTRLNSSH